jgi:diadenosine tetraphosphate (Ap4A) HIT family hydrolase
MTETLIHRRVAEARAGTNPTVIARLPSGWVVAGDTQIVRGYSLLLPDPVAPDLNALRGAERMRFLLDMAALGDVLLEVTGAARINYEMLGNTEKALHAHLFPRYDAEPEPFRSGPIWLYDWSAAPRFDRDQCRPWMEAVAAALERRPT